MLNRLKTWLQNHSSKKIDFQQLTRQKEIFLYAGDVPQDARYSHYVGLSISQSNYRHLRHDIKEPLLLPNDCVSRYQSEDVFEHIDPSILPTIINEIYRVLLPGALFRLSLPDYRCDVLAKRSLKDKDGKIVFDPSGGGDFIEGKVVDGGHVWFPVYEEVRRILQLSYFSNVNFLHYYDEAGNGVAELIDYSLGYVMRTPDNDKRVMSPYRPMSIVVDCYK